MNITSKKILITGSEGQLGKTLYDLLHQYNNITFINHAQLDLSNELAVSSYFNKNQYDYIINCAAYTNVDAAETNKDTALGINTLAVKHIANQCFYHNMKLIQISTDYVFNGKVNKPYTETDFVEPINYYGRTKLDGDWYAITILNNNVLVLRTSWLYSPYKNNFVKLIINLAKEKDEISVVNDQVSSPTNALDLANAIIKIINTDEWHGGIYHYSNEGVASRYDFAYAILKLIGSKCKITPITSLEYETIANRPYYTVLNKNRIRKTFNIEIPHWYESLKTSIKAFIE